MKPLPAPNVPGDTDSQRMSNALKTVLSVSKAHVLKAEEDWKKKNARKRVKKQS